MTTAKHIDVFTGRGRKQCNALQAGDYIALYEDHPGSAEENHLGPTDCGYSGSAIAWINAHLDERELRIVADDKGLRVQVIEEWDEVTEQEDE